MKAIFNIIITEGEKVERKTIVKEMEKAGGEGSGR